VAACESGLRWPDQERRELALELQAREGLQDLRDRSRGQLPGPRSVDVGDGAGTLLERPGLRGVGAVGLEGSPRGLERRQQAKVMQRACDEGVLGGERAPLSCEDRGPEQVGAHAVVEEKERAAGTRVGTGGARSGGLRHTYARDFPGDFRRRARQQPRRQRSQQAGVLAEPATLHGPVIPGVGSGQRRPRSDRFG
jgi:hypothetical protein